MVGLSENTWATVLVLSFNRLSSPVPHLSSGEKQCGSLPFPQNCGVAQVRLSLQKSFLNCKHRRWEAVAEL